MRNDDKVGSFHDICYVMKKLKAWIIEIILLEKREQFWRRLKIRHKYFCFDSLGLFWLDSIIRYQIAVQTWSKCIKKFLGCLGEKVDNIFQPFYLDLIEQYNRSFLGGFVTLNFSPRQSTGLSVMHSISKVPTPFCPLSDSV